VRGVTQQLLAVCTAAVAVLGVTEGSATSEALQPPWDHLP